VPDRAMRNVPTGVITADHHPMARSRQIRLRRVLSSCRDTIAGAPPTLPSHALEGAPPVTSRHAANRRASCRSVVFARIVTVEQLTLILKTAGLFVATALAEIIGCFLPYLWLRKGGPAWLLIPAAVSLALFVWLLTLHPAASGRVYAAYGGVYVATALVWLRVVDGVKLSGLDWLGAGVALLGMSIIVLGWPGKG